MSEEQVGIFNGLLSNADGVEDEVGRLAQKCFHIENVGGKLFHFLNFDEEEYEKVSDKYDGENPTQDPRFSLVKSDKLKKLPTCDNCFTSLKRRYEWKCDTGNEYESEKCPALHKFCFKRRILAGYQLICQSYQNLAAQRYRLLLRIHEYYSYVTL